MMLWIELNLALYMGSRYVCLTAPAECNKNEGKTVGYLWIVVKKRSIQPASLEMTVGTFAQTQ